MRFYLSFACAFPLFSFTLGAPPTAVNCPLNAVSWFNQTLNHEVNNRNASVGSGKFKQRYQLNTTFFKPGGPILFMQNAESNLACIEDTVFQDWAEDMGAILAGLEHRFFGESVPEGFDATTAKPEEYAPLTMNNTLLDSVNFIQWIKRTVPNAKDSRVFVMGGSYGGTLTTLLRVWHPETFYGAIPSAPLLKSLGIESKNPDRFEWYKWVSQSYRDESAEAAAKIKHAMFDFNTSFVSADKLKKIAQDAHFCEPYPSNLTEWATFYGELILVYYFGTQYNYQWANPATFNISRPLKTIINQTLSANNTGEVIRIPMQLYARQPANQCLPWNSSAFGTDSVLQTNVWDRVACLSVPGSTSDIAPGGIFPPQDNQVNNVKDCLDMGLNPSFANQTNDEIIKHYRFTAPDLIKTKRLLFTQGGYDPTTAVGPPVFPVSNDREATRTVLMHGLAHAEEVMGQSFPGADSVPLQMAHKIMKDTIMDWAGLVSDS